MSQSTKTRVAITGFGRIGKTAARIILASHPELELVAINCSYGAKNVAYGLKYDTTYGIFEHPVKHTDNEEITIDIPKGKKTVKIVSERDPKQLPWKEMKIDVVLECTGVFKDMEGASKHITAGAKKVAISAPAKSPEIPTIVQGVNDKEAIEKLKNSGLNIISNASCTTNCVAPAIKAIHDNFNIESILGITIHAYTASQKLLDGNNKKGVRDSRAAAVNAIPTSTGAAKAVVLVMPELQDKINLTAVRVPLVTGSMVYLTFNLDKEVAAEEINKAIKKEAEGRQKGILQYSEEELVSSDIISNQYSCIIDSELTEVLGKTVKLVLWYDNEWGYSNRLVELANKIL